MSETSQCDSSNEIFEVSSNFTFGTYFVDALSNHTCTFCPGSSEDFVEKGQSRKLLGLSVTMNSASNCTAVALM